jgi:hypothetical protein
VAENASYRKHLRECSVEENKMIEWKWLLILIIAAGVHELGHFIAYRYFKIKPSLKIKWWGILLGQEDFHWLTVKKAFVVLWSGVMLGFGYLLLFNPPTNYLLIYFMFSGLDIINIISLLDFNKHDTRPIVDIQIEQLYKWKTDNEKNKPVDNP